VLPAALVLGLFHVLPILYLGWMSLFRWSFEPEAFVGLANYAALLSDPEFGQSLLQTVYYALGTVPLEMALALAIAVPLSGRLAARGFYRLLYFLPNVTSTVAAGVVFAWIFTPQSGLANVVLRALGLPPQRWMLESGGVLALALGHFGIPLPAWAGGPSLALAAIGLFTIWHGLGFQVLLFLAGLTAIPRELHEAARTDGAGSWQVFRQVTLPQLRPTIVFVATVSVIFAFRAFNQFYVMTQGRPGNPLGSTSVASIFVFRTFYAKTQLGYASAAALVLFLVILALSLLQARQRRLDAAA
jgi:multiple sugar transport system permease protein